MSGGESKFERPIGSLSAIRTYNGPPQRKWRTRSSYEKEKREFIEDDELPEEETHWRDPVALQYGHSGPSTPPSAGYEEPQSPPPALPRGGHYPYSPTTPIPPHRLLLPPRLAIPGQVEEDEEGALPKKRKYVHRSRSNADFYNAPQRPTMLLRRSTADDVVPRRNVLQGLGGLISRRTISSKPPKDPLPQVCISPLPHKSSSLLITLQQMTEISTIEFRQRRSEMSSSLESPPASPSRLRRHLSFLSSQAGSPVDRPQVMESFLEDEDYHYEYDEPLPSPPPPPPHPDSFKPD